MRFKPFEPDGGFTRFASNAQAEVRNAAVRSAGVTLFWGAVSLAVQTLATMALGRLVSPRDFGLVTIVTTISLLLASFGDTGLPEAIVQREKMNRTLASNLFWINVTGGFLFTIAFAAAGSLFAWFYHDIELERVAVGVSPMMLFYSTATVHLALLKRAMRFSEASLVTICGRVASGAVSVVMAWMGFGHWALVAGAVALPLTQTLAAWYFCRWMPVTPRRVPGTGDTYWFGFITYGRFCLNYISRNTDNMLIAWRFNANALGFYKKAYDLFSLSATQFSHALAMVVVSALNRIERGSTEYRRFLLQALTAMAFLGMGLAAELTLIGKDLIRLLLGPGWEQSGRIFTFFGPGVGIMILYYTHGWIHLSLGKANRWFRWGVVEVVVTVSLFVAGLPWGPIGIAVAWTLSYWLLTLPALWYAGKPIQFGVGPIIRAIWRYVLAALFTGVAVTVVINRISWLASASGSEGAALRILATSLLVVVVYLASTAALYGSPAPIYQSAQVVRQMLIKRRSQAAAGEAEPLAGQPGLADRTVSPIRAQHHPPLVSILLPAYNAEKWIEEALQSAISQTWPNKEIIVVVDGSTDRTLAIAKRFASENVRVEVQHHQGAAAARNRAFSLSLGDYIQWLDADDLLAPDKIALQMAAAAGCDKWTLFSGEWSSFMYRRHRATFATTALSCDLPPTEWIFRKLGMGVFMQTGAWLVSRELTEAAGPWDTRLLGDDDGEYFCRVALKSKLIRFVPNARAYYRYTGSNSLSSIWYSQEKLEAHWLSMQLHIRYLLREENSERTRAACLRYLQESMICFFPERPHIVATARLLARELGGELALPRLSWKYAWMRRIFGWRIAKRASVTLPALRWSMARGWDKLMLFIEKRSGAVANPRRRTALFANE